ncbi:MAG: glycoside hydrolase family 3 C-terminal domain-containing protein [Tolumonas sp.]|nr:glycoside hydrolase family 3 C-terminal domain-containing protein [Tolumonas sp.]
MRLNKITSAMMISAAAFIWGCGGSGSDSGQGSDNNNPVQDSIKPGLSVSDSVADKRAKAILSQMTLDQKIQLVHGHGMPNFIYGYQKFPGMFFGPEGALPDAVSYIPGIPALGIPDNNFVDSAAGPNVPNQFVTTLPAPIAVASTWDPSLAELAGRRAGLEARTLGFASAVGGAGLNLTRDPRNGRTFEYAGEDPVLGGEMAAQRIIGTQSQQVMMATKHYAMNNSETDRFVSNSVVDEQTMRETELLAYEIAVEKGNPAYVMCAYNRINSVFSCENKELLDALKKDMGFKGMVQSDWSATRSTVASALAGLDEEQPGITRIGENASYIIKAFFNGGWFAQRLSDAVSNGDVPMERLDDMVFRKLRSMIVTGVMDNPPTGRYKVDQTRGQQDAYKIAADSMVLLKNGSGQNGVEAPLPLQNMAGKKITVIGIHADKGVIAGGGSGGSQPYFQNQVDLCDENPAYPYAVCPTFLGATPLDAIRKEFPDANINYLSGDDLNAAESAAADSDVTIIFAGVWYNEGTDQPNLSLPSPATDTTKVFTYDQDALISAVAKKSKKSIVVLETGSAVTMPWISDVDAVLNAWYPGQMGAYAIADILSGDVNPSGKLPLTFPKDETQLVMPELPFNVGAKFSPVGIVLPFMEPELQPAIDSALGEGMYNRLISIPYNEKLLSNGYKWMDANNIEPLFRFGYGLSYTTFGYSDVSSSRATDGSVDVTFTITNTGSRAGAEVAQVYASLPANVPGHVQPPKKLVGWKKVELAAGASKSVTVNVPKKYISTWDADSKHTWVLTPGRYDFNVSDSADLNSANALSTSLTLNN